MNLTSKTVSILALSLFIFHSIDAQTKRIKRPKSSVGIYSVDTFVRESFDIYDKVYRYDGYAEAGKPLDDDDIDILEDAITDVERLTSSAPNVMKDLDGQGALKQAKATLQINKAKKALKYSLVTAKKLLAGKRSGDTEDETKEGTSTDGNSGGSNSGGNDSGSSSGGTNTDSNSGGNTEFEVSSKFDFVPGDKLLFFDDYSSDYIGDFPSKWNTNGSGEVVTISNTSERWLEFLSGSGIYFLPNNLSLPEEYTIEFDLIANGLDRKTSSNAMLEINLSDDANFKRGENYVQAWVPFGQYAAFGIRVRNHVQGKGYIINNTVTADIRKAVLNRPHISIAVNKERFRLWVNEKKYVDIPKMIPRGKSINTLKFNLEYFADGKERLFITNLKVAEGGLDLRRTLLSEGKVSTNGILFDSGSSVIKPQSYGILRQISQVLQQESGMNLKIVGHTDSDGQESNNLALSKSRAEAVKTALITTYGISSSRLSAEGMGETQPIADNSTTEGKAQNRRVEFIKQ
ncbi:MAG: OmpA family protein [Bacteroidota bacterium]